MKNNKLMFDLTNNSTSEPLLAEGVFGAALLQAKSVETFSKILNAKDTVKLGLHDFGNVLQSASCSPADQGAGTLDEKEVSVCALDVYFTVCQRTLEQSFISAKLAAGSNNVDFLPSDFQAYLSTKLAEKIASDIEVVAFQGNTYMTGSTYPNTLCNGLQVKLSGDSTVVDVTATATTSSNVIANLTAVYNAISDEVMSKPDLAIYVSSNIARAYRQALANASAEAFYNQKDLKMSFLDIEIIEAPGMSANKMIAAQKSNLFLMSDLVSDFTDIMLIPQLDKTGKHQIVVSGSFKFAVDYAVGADIVYWS
jgi:hypothetical protein